MLKVGDEYSEQICFTQEMENMFMDITGDRNPIHYDIIKAKEANFPAPVVHGMLAASIMGKVFGMSFPGEGSINIERHFLFARPMFIGESYYMKFKVSEIDADKHIGLLKCKIKNAEGKICIDCTTRIKNENQF